MPLPTQAHPPRRCKTNVMNERSSIRLDVIEYQRDHKEKNQVREAYNHAKYWDERCTPMQWWSHHLDNSGNKFKGNRQIPAGDDGAPIAGDDAPSVPPYRMG